jgi:hypothetical protein
VTRKLYAGLLYRRLLDIETILIYEASKSPSVNQTGPSRLSTKVALIAVVAVLYAVAKGVVAFIPSPWGVASLYIAVFVPAFFAVVSDFYAVAIGAALGTFIGDTLFLTALNTTNPLLSLVAGVPANFIAFLLFGWFIRKYPSWPAFVAATVSFVTLGNAIAAFLVAYPGAYVYAPVALAESAFPPATLAFGLTAFFNSTSIPAVIIGVPILLRATRPLFGRSAILERFPDWAQARSTRERSIALVFGVVFSLVGAAFFLVSYSLSTAFWPNVTTYFSVIAIATIVLVPIIGTIVVPRQAIKPAP